MNKVTFLFSQNLKALMEGRAINQTDLSVALNLPQSSVSGWITGEKLPRPDKIELLADYFGVNIADLFAEPGQTPTSPAQGVENMETYTKDLAKLLERLETMKDFIPGIK